jgi:hypothetical protein
LFAFHRAGSITISNCPFLTRCNAMIEQTRYDYAQAEAIMKYALLWYRLKYLLGEDMP